MKAQTRSRNAAVFIVILGAIRRGSTTPSSDTLSPGNSPGILYTGG